MNYQETLRERQDEADAERKRQEDEEREFREYVKSIEAHPGYVKKVLEALNEC